MSSLSAVLLVRFHKSHRYSVLRVHPGESVNSRMFVRSPNVKMVARRVCDERLSNHLTAICHFELARFAYIMLIPSFSAHIVRTRTAFLESQAADNGLRHARPRCTTKLDVLDGRGVSNVPFLTALFIKASPPRHRLQATTYPYRTWFLTQSHASHRGCDCIGVRKYTTLRAPAPDAQVNPAFPPSCQLLLAP